MTRPKDIGTQWETTVVRYLRSNGFPNAERRALSGSCDKGDLLIAPGLIAECKAHTEYSDADVRDWWQQTDRERHNSNAEMALLIVKRKGLRGQPGNAWCWRRCRGVWHATWLSEAVEELRYIGWGDDPRG